MIPHQNVRNLMLNDDVTNDIREGRFHLWAVRTIDEGLEVVTGIPGGEADAAGAFPEGTINHMVSRRLGELADRLRRFGPARAGREEATREEAAREEAAREEPAERDPAPATPPADEPEKEEK
jgi:predicted ATP-dependent protease